MRCAVEVVPGSVPHPAPIARLTTIATSATAIMSPPFTGWDCAGGDGFQPIHSATPQSERAVHERGDDGHAMIAEGQFRRWRVCVRSTSIPTQAERRNV